MAEDLFTLDMGIEGTATGNLTDFFNESETGAATATPEQVVKVETQVENAKEIIKEEPEEKIDLLAVEEKPKIEIKEEKVIDDNQFSTLSQDLFKLGVFNKEEEEEDVDIKTPEDFLERFNHEKKKGSVEIIDNFLGKFGDDYKDAFDAIFVKGVDPKQYFQTAEEITNLQEIDLTDYDNQERIVRKALQNQGLSKEAIDKKVQKSKDFGDLEDDAKIYHEILVKQESGKLQQLAAVKETQLAREREIKNQYINNVSTILDTKLKTKEFDGIPLTPKVVEELKTYLLADAYKLPNGELLTEFDKDILDLKRPDNHELKAKLALLIRTLKVDPSLSVITKKATTKAAEQLFSTTIKTKQTNKTDTKSTSVFW